MANLSYLGEYFQTDDYRMIQGQADPRENFSILEIHDWPRFVSGEFRHNPWKSRLGAFYLMTAQGMPVIYYGQEQGFNGDCHYHSMNVGHHRQSIEQLCQGYDHALNRQDMFMTGPWRLGSTVDSINNLAYIGKPQNLSTLGSWLEDPYLARDHMVYKNFRKLNHIRRSCQPLREGNTYVRWTDNAREGLLAFSRIHHDSEILVVLNTSSVAMNVNKILVDANLNHIPGTEYKDLISGHMATITKDSDYSSAFLDFHNFRLEGNSAAIMVYNDNVTEWNHELQAHLCK